MNEMMRTAVRLAGILILVAAVRGLVPHVIQIQSGVGSELHDLLGVSAHALIAVIAVGLVLFPGLLTQGRSGDFEMNAAAPDWDALQRFLIAMLGIYFTAQAMIDAAYYVTYWIIYAQQSSVAPFSFQPPAELVGGVVSTAVEFVVGAGLVVASGKVAGMLKKLREI